MPSPWFVAAVFLGTTAGAVIVGVWLQRELRRHRQMLDARRRLIEEARSLLEEGRCPQCDSRWGTWDGRMSPLTEDASTKIVYQASTTRLCPRCGHATELRLWIDNTRRWGFTANV